MPISHEPFELHPWFFAGKQTLPREIRPKKLVFWRWVQPAQPAQPTYQMKKRKSGITFEWVSRFGWNFAWKLLKSIYITSMKKSLAKQIYTALPNQPKMVLIEIFWKFMKFRFFSWNTLLLLRLNIIQVKNILILIFCYNMLNFVFFCVQNLSN